MGEKGLAATAGDAAGSTSFVSEVGDTVTTTVSDAGETLKDKLVDHGVDHAIDEGRERLRKPGEPEAGSS